MGAAGDLVISANMIAIGGVIFGVLSFIVMVIAVRTGIKKITDERTAREVAQALLVARLEKCEKDLIFAYDKIRNIEGNQGKFELALNKVDITMNENVRVLRNVERLMMDTARIDQKLESHLSQHNTAMLSMGGD